MSAGADRSRDAAGGWVAVTVFLAGPSDDGAPVLRCADVMLYTDATVRVYLTAALVAHRDVSGDVWFDADGNVVQNRVNDSFTSAKLSDFALRAAENRARSCVQLARRQLAELAGTHPVRRAGKVTR